MRKPMLIAGLFVLALFLGSWIKEKTLQDRKAIANKWYNDVMLYHYSIPDEEYETLGQIEIKFIVDDKPGLLMQKLVKKAKEKYPNTQGIIINDLMGSAEAIKFKE